ncbi:hypothetical protein QQ73_21685, partial [Candidatus Endoriftia persephone str. Guaymas]|nr:hypothetical protein [Candidatus Endoriftia persephone str. Guaymas]
QVLQARGASDRLLKIFSVSPEPDDENMADMPLVRGKILFRDVQFHYPGRPDTLKNLNLCISAGETVAITGLNGAGKSTIFHLLMRFSDPQAGSIQIDGIDLRDVSLASLRQQIGLVTQNTLLFSGTVAENISYGRIDAGEEDIEAAARAAHAHAFISDLLEG